VGSAAQTGALERNARARINFMVPPIIRHIFEAGRDTNPSIKNGRWYEQGWISLRRLT
jgi:hypothetical protein